MGLTSGSELLKKTAEQSFWNSYYAIPNPFEGLVWMKESTQITDTYARLGAAPMPQAFNGDRDAKVSNEYTYSITNEPFDSTVKIDKKLVKYEQWGEVANLIANQGSKARDHKTKLLSTLLEAGVSTVCEDGQFYFDDDHANAGAEYTTSQDNDLTSNITTVATPTDIEFATAVRGMQDAFFTFKDDRGDPTVPATDDASTFVLMVPPTYRSIARRVLLADALTGPVGNDLRGTYTLRVNPFLTAPSATGAIYMFNAASNHKPLICQQTGGIERRTEEESKSGDFLHSATWWGQVDYGQWRSAVSHVFT
jgi:hypothetical protein